MSEFKVYLNTEEVRQISDSVTNNNKICFGVKEVLHLVMRLSHPEKKQTAFQPHEFRSSVLTEPNKNMNEVFYSKIPSKIYKEVLKRKKLWKIGSGEGETKNEKCAKLIDFIENTLAFLEIREDAVLF